MLAAAVLAQVLRDATARRPDVRQEALAFLHDEQALGFWSDLWAWTGPSNGTSRACCAMSDRTTLPWAIIVA